jgi:hypothetical protein
MGMGIVWWSKLNCLRICGKLSLLRLAVLRWERGCPDSAGELESYVFPPGAEAPGDTIAPAQAGFQPHLWGVV